jgi:hypothetical protein
MDYPFNQFVNLPDPPDSPAVIDPSIAATEGAPPSRRVRSRPAKLPDGEARRDG